nr:alkaline phosphatase [Bacillus pumilus]
MGSMDRKNRIFLMCGILAVLVLAVLLTSHDVTPVSTKAADKKQTKTPKNIIFIVGDGMGMPVIKAYRTFKQRKAWFYKSTNRLGPVFSRDADHTSR